MTQITVIRHINAPMDVVFKSVADIEHLTEPVSYVVKIEFLSERKSGVGTRFRETRLVDGKESITELEVTEYTENERIRMIADTHGTIWDSVFTVTSAGEQTELKLVMDARGQGFIQRVMNALLKGLYRKGLEKHIEEVKKFCEKK